MSNSIWGYSKVRHLIEINPIQRTPVECLEIDIEDRNKLTLLMI